MSTDGGLRRVLPPPRERPGLLQVIIRWRWELFLLASIAKAWHDVGGAALGIVALVLVQLIAFVPIVRSIAVDAVLFDIVPHRVRSGLVEAGVTDRNGRPPWIMVAWPVADAVEVEIWLRSGTTIGDLRHAVPLIASACGATCVEVVQPSRRQDQAILVVHHPRWGWLGR